MTRHGVRRRALAAVVAALGVVVMGSTATHADATACSGSASVSVTVDATHYTITSAQLCAAADVFNTTYQTRGIAGTANTQDTPQVQQGTSIRALLSSLGVAPGSVDFVDVPRGDGTWTTLAGDDLADPSDFARSLAPVFVVNGDHIDYYRPLYADPNDVNAADHVQSTAGGVLAVGVHAGPLLTVTATANATKVTTGTPVTFAATVSGGTTASTPYRFVWAFGDGSSGRGRTVTHPFTTTGDYDAQVTVAGADNSGGVSGQVQITVGTPAKGGHGPGGGSNHNPHHPATGPTNGHGHQTGGRPSRHGSSGHSSGGQPNGISLPPLPPNIGNNVITSSTIDGVTPLIASSLPTVTGRVVSPGMTLSAEQTAVAARATAPAARLGGSGLQIAGGVVAAAGVVLLLGLGMARELRSSHGRSERAS